MCLSVQRTIRDAVEDTLTWPVRKVVPILPGDYRYTLCNNKTYILELLCFQNNSNSSLTFCGQ